MQTFKLLLSTIVLGSLAGVLQSCKKDSAAPQNPATATTSQSPANTSARMWNPTKTLYGVGLKPGSMTATIYKISPPPISGLMPGPISGLFLGGTTQLTYVTGVAYTSGAVIVSTGPMSNAPNRLLTYTFGTWTSPASTVPCAGITDIEFNEYDGRLYGILNNMRIVQIATSGAITINYVPALSSGQLVKGLCNYNGLLSYSISDNTPAPDFFYSYNPATPGPTPVLFSTDWGLGDGGMQYCDGGFGWVILSFTDTKKTIGPPPYPVAGPATMPGAPYQMVDLTSD